MQTKPTEVYPMTFLIRPLTLHFLSVIALLAVAGAHSAARAGDGQIKFNYNFADVSAVIEDYSKASGQKFIYDPQVRGKVTVLNPQKISLDEAFAQLSTALAVNGLGISKQGEVMVVMQARAIQRNYINMGAALPPPRPEQMFTWVIELKHASADGLGFESLPHSKNHRSGGPAAYNVTSIKL